MDRDLKILLVEDVATDAELMVREVKRAGISCTSRRVDAEPDFRASLETFSPDIILSDFSLPAFDGQTALGIARREHPETPFVFVSGTIGEERAIESLKLGAADYVLKTNLARLPAAIHRALKQAEERTARKRAEAALQKSVERFETVARATNDVLWDWDIAADTFWCNDAFEHLYGHSAGASTPMTNPWISHVHPDDKERVMEGFRQTIASGQVYWSDEYRFRRRNGEEACVLDRAYLIRDAAGVAVRMIGAMMDITERRQQQEKIARLSRIHAVLSGINAAIVRIRDRQELLDEATRIAVDHGNFALAWIGLADFHGAIVRPSAWTGDATGVAAMHLSLGQGDELSLADRVVADKKPFVCDDIDKGGVSPAVQINAAAGGYRSLAILPLIIGERALGVLALCAREPGFFDREELKLLSELVADISFALEYIEKEEKLSYLAYYDALTGLPNRTLFLDRLQQLVQGAKRNAAGNDLRIAVFAIDVERFRLINQTLGRQTGDELLKRIAASLREVLQGNDHIARLGADDFALALSHVDEPDLISVLEQKIIGALDRGFVVNGEELRVGLKAGIALFPNDGLQSDVLLTNAETALKKAKEINEKYLFYTPQFNARIANKLNLETRLRKALEGNQFVLYYQPKVDLISRALTGFEALLRWQDPTLGLRFPAEYIALLEETGLIFEVGKWVIGQALSDQQRWRALGLNPPEVAVNVSALQLRKRDFVSELQAFLWDGEGAPSLSLEITESVVMENLTENVCKLRALREMGVTIAVDDFGTGYSSLSYIARLPVDVLKIDRSFITNMTVDRYSRSIVATVISLAEALDLKVVAEGVETEAQAALLRLLKCDEMQGQLTAMAMPVAEIETLLLARAERASF
ncbi:MAG: EAL domain-containing protein [Pseudomonadota bacterium]|nr:EAL domain-containing protein [Pseudomonadota bacterium]